MLHLAAAVDTTATASDGRLILAAVLGIGMIVAVAETDAPRALRLLRRLGEAPVAVGAVANRKRGGARVVYR